MPLATVHYRSSALQKCVGMHVITPDPSTFPPPWPVCYLLHGLSDDFTIWQRRTSIERYAEHLPLMVVMPDGGRGFYCDADQGPAYERAVVQDCIGLVDTLFPTKAERGGRCIGGLSMGGYGAMKLAFKHPELFASAVSHSGCLNIARSTPREELSDELRRIFGHAPANGKDDLFALAERISRDLLPAVRFDCGVDDFLLEHNRAFHAHLDSLDIPHEYEEFPGAHSWDYWDEHVQEALAFHARALGLESPNT